MGGRFLGRRPLATLLVGCCLVALIMNLQLFMGPPQEPRQVPASSSTHPDAPTLPYKPHGEPESPVSPSKSTASQPPLPSRPPTPSYAHSLPPVESNKQTLSDPCVAYPEHSDLVIVVKTGATEASKKLPLQLTSFLACAKKDLLIFSDMEQDLGNIHIYDSLDEVDPELRGNNSAFTLYDTQKQYVLDGDDVGMLSHRSEQSWGLDKYKNIHTAQKAWRLRPNKSWYFFIDADTYIVWSSFFNWLAQLDSTKKLYLGAEVPGEYDMGFAHGGSGYLLSGPALAQLSGDDAKEIAAEYDQGVHKICCGDVQLAKSLSEKGVKVQDAHPMINGEKSRRYKFGERLWCQPLVTMHHIHAEEMNDVWQFEQRRSKPKEPLLFSELFTAYIEPRLPIQYRDKGDRISEDPEHDYLPAEREGWDNLSEDIKYERPDPDAKPSDGKLASWLSSSDPHLDAYTSLEKCRKACKEIKECMAYVYSPESCHLSKSFRFGSSRAPEGAMTWTSGWELDKIRKLKEAKTPCKVVDYKSYSQLS